MSTNINRMFGALTEQCRKRAGHLIILELSDEGTYFMILDGAQKPRAKVEYNDTKGTITISAISEALKEKIKRKGVNTVFTEKSAPVPDIQAEYIAKLICA